MEYNFISSILVVKNPSFPMWQMWYIFIKLIQSFQHRLPYMLMKLKLRYMLKCQHGSKYYTCISSLAKFVAKAEFLVVYVILTVSLLPCLQSGRLDPSYWHASRGPAMGYPAESTALFKKLLQFLELSFLLKHSLSLFCEPLSFIHFNYMWFSEHLNEYNSLNLNKYVWIHPIFHCILFSGLPQPAFYTIPHGMCGLLCHVYWHISAIKMMVAI